MTGNRYIMTFLLVHTGVTVDVSAGESSYITNVLLYMLYSFFIHSLSWVYLRISSDTGVHVFKQSMHTQFVHSRLLPVLTIQPLAILSYILSKLKHYISGNYVCYIIVNLFIFHAVSIVIYPEPTELFFVFLFFCL